MDLRDRVGIEQAGRGNVSPVIDGQAATGKQRSELLDDRLNDLFGHAGTGFQSIFALLEGGKGEDIVNQPPKPVGFFLNQGQTVRRPFRRLAQHLFGEFEIEQNIGQG